MRVAPFERLLPPPPGLRAALRGLWCMTEPHVAGPDAQVVPPDDRVELVFHTGEGWIDGSGAREPLPQVFVGGLRTGPVRVVTRGLTHMLSAWLHPWAAAAVLGLPGPAQGTVLEAGSGLRALGGELLPLLARGAHGEAVERLERWLAGRPGAAGPTAPEGRDGWRGGALIWERAGAVSLASVAAREGCSVRQLERRFRRAMGISPRELARLVRFARAADRLDAAPATDLAALAFERGYADQPHLTRDFRRFAGTTPGRYARRAGGAPG